MTEPDVALTDFGLALECGIFAWILARTAAWAALRRAFVIFFGSIGLAAAAGGAVHGFFLDEAGAAHRLLWPIVLISIGLTALSAWAIGARLLFASRSASAIRAGALILFAAYAAAVLLGARSYSLVILHYLPAALFLTVALAVRFARSGERGIPAALTGLLLTFPAAAMQQMKIGLHPLYFNHNALYHAIQAVALLLIFLGARVLAGREPAPDGGR